MPGIVDSHSSGRIAVPRVAVLALAAVAVLRAGSPVLAAGPRQPGTTDPPGAESTTRHIPRRHIGRNTHHKATSRVSLGYLTPGEASFAAARAFRFYLNVVSADVFAVTPSGGISGDIPGEVVTHGNANGMATWACVTNFTTDFDPGLAHRTIVYNRATVIADLLTLAEQGGFAGVNIDFEGMYPADRDAFSSFVSDLAAALHGARLTLAVSAPAKTADDPDDTWSWPFDYASIGADADYVQLMTYDQHGPWSEPGPVAGADWVEDCLGFAATLIAPDKLLVGLPAYGYDWDLADPAGHTSFSWKDVPALIASSGATPRWDAASSSPYLTYTDAAHHEHVAWFENAASITAKTGLVVDLDLAGLSMWSLGQEDPAFWQAAMAGLR